MATGGNTTLTTAEEIVFLEATQFGGCSKFWVGVPTGEANRALVNVPGIHESGEYLNLSAGQDAVFESSPIGIKKVVAKSNTGTTVLNYGVISRD